MRRQVVYIVLFWALAAAVLFLHSRSQGRYFTYTHCFHNRRGIHSNVNYACAAIMDGGLQLAYCRDWPWSIPNNGWASFPSAMSDEVQPQLLQGNKLTTDDHLLGFRLLVGNAAWPIMRYSPFASVRIPLLFVVFVLIVLPFLPTGFGRFQWIRRHRERAGRCQGCGYDLRASPQRCPECGQAV